MASIEPALLSLADTAAHGLGLDRRPLAADALISEAERRVGRRFASRGFEIGLRRLLDACAAEADLNLLGRLTLRWDALRLLTNLLRLEAEEKRDPATFAAPIEAPVFIAGMPRSGTTFLHALLAEDPGNRAPLCWETIEPFPDPRDGRRDRRIERVQGQLRAFNRVAPGLASVQPLDARQPQECTEITSLVFQSLRFDATYRIPSYTAWLDDYGHLAAFRVHKRFLQYLQAPDLQTKARPRWVLKCPDNVFTLEAIEAVYPDARFVFVHRDPFAVVRSLAKLTELLRAPFTRSLDRVGIGAELVDRWGLAADLTVEASARLPPERMFHLHYAQVTRAPLAAIASAYEHFGIPLEEDAKRRISALVAARPRGGYGVNRYDPSEHGLDRARVEQRFAAYNAAFAGLAPSVAGAP
jgi:hypothetical protein